MFLLKRERDEFFSAQVHNIYPLDLSFGCALLWLSNKCFTGADERNISQSFVSPWHTIPPCDLLTEDKSKLTLFARTLHTSALYEDER